MIPSPELHSALLTAAAIGSVLLSALLVARSPRFVAPGLHALYGGALAWWLFCMASLATAPSDSAAQTWARLAHLGIGLLPAVVFHLNAATAGLMAPLRRAIRIHYGVAALVTAFCVGSPWLFEAPRTYPWGTYFSYSAWGALPIGFLVVTLGEIFWIYRRALRSATPGTAHFDMLRGIHFGNLFAALVLIDYLPGFGFDVYPPGYLVLTTLQVLNLYGAVGDRLVQITPEFAADSILHTIPDGVFAVDSAGVVRFANEAAARMLGATAAALVDRPLGEAVEDRVLLEAFASGAAGETVVRELETRGSDGSPRVVRVAEASLRVRPDQPLARVYVLHDLTEQRQAEADAERLEGWVRRSQKLETLGVMAGGIAHDFNNLLTVILGGVELAQAEVDKDHPSVESLDTIAAATERASELTAQMLAYAGQGSGARRPMDLNTRCRDMAELIRSAVSKKAQLRLELGDDLPPIVADESQVSQIVLNLLTNASEALGDDIGRITLRTGLLPGQAAGEGALDAEASYVFIEVSDTGCGMSPETRSRIFDPFYSTKFTGRGLGLATTMGIVEAHGGRMRVESELGRGSCFTVALPAAPGAHIRELRAPEDDRRWRGHGLALVADDEPGVRAVLSRMLLRAGFQVVEARDGREALALFRARRAEFVLGVVDATMPELDGIGVLRAIRLEAPSLPVVVVSGFEEAGAVELSNDPRAAFLPKPFRAAELAEKVREIMGPDRSS